MIQAVDLQEEARRKSKRWARTLIVAGILFAIMTVGPIFFAIVVEALYYEGWGGLWPDPDDPHHGGIEIERSSRAKAESWKHAENAARERPYLNSELPS